MTNVSQPSQPYQLAQLSQRSQQPQPISSAQQCLPVPAGVTSFSQVSQQLADLEAIDYFFAKDLTCAIPVNIDALAQDANSAASLFFHLLIALSTCMRDGHTCLPIKQVAGTVLGFKAERGVCSHQGFNFADVSTIDTLLNALYLAPEHQQAVVYFHGALYVRRYFSFERQLKQLVSDKTQLIANKKSDREDTSPLSLVEIKSCLSQLFPESQHDSNANSDEVDIDWQQVAVANALNKNFTVIAGGPGTGKTYTVTKLLAALVMLEQLKLSKRASSARSANSQAGAEGSLRISLVAPTGKAAQRLSESIGQAVENFKGLVPDAVLADIPDSAQTIHRLLGVIPNQVQFKHHQDNLLTVDVLLVDEVSMVDLALMTRLLQALPPHCKVILLGDADQLPSVAIGSVLADIAPRPHPGYSQANRDYLTALTGFKIFKTAPASRCSDHLTLLTKSRRFDSEGGIGKLAVAVINGQAKTSWQILTNQKRAPSSEPTPKLNYPEFHYPELKWHQEELSQWLTPLVKQYYLPIFQCTTIESAFDALAKFRVLSATRVGEQGVDYLNQLIVQILAQYQVHQPLNRGNGLGGHGELFHGQPIMINENNYQLGLYNGDIGMIWRQENGQLLAGFIDLVTEQDELGNKQLQQKVRWLMPSRLPSFETVYAMTIHKTQGSEFEHVAMVLGQSSDNKLLSRELLYTAITRAKQQLTVGCSANVWHSGVEAQVQRYSGFNC